MLRNLVKIANRLDSLGLHNEADIIDSIIKEASDDMGEPKEKRRTLAERLIDEKLDFYMFDNPEATEEELAQKREEFTDLANHLFANSYRLAPPDAKHLLYDIYLNDNTTAEDLDNYARWLDKSDTKMKSTESAGFLGDPILS
jgi:hypothetical protein